MSGSSHSLSLSRFRDQVLGCWTGKNIGGTLGGPFEGNREVHDVSFYTQELGGRPLPNDDLDLQMIWLLALEENGVYRVNERVLGEYWLTHITGPWNEYGVCKANMRNGLMPPLSGSCNNDDWKFSNGAWIRSEIWACLFPGSPDEAAAFAYADACCDHCGEGIYAELFTASLESAAFVVDDLRELIRIGLARIPEECRVARSVALVCEAVDRGQSWLETRQALVRDSEDLGWFQAPANIGFVVLGLLYGEGDFGRSVCLATNCGDDTDCTAGTVGAILGIRSGRSGLPAKWVEPIGESIETCSICRYERNNQVPLPRTLGELTDRVVAMARTARAENPALPEFVPGEASFDGAAAAALARPGPSLERLWARSPFEMTFDLPFGRVRVDIGGGPFLEPGREKRLTITLGHVRFIEKTASLRLRLPEGWTALPSEEFRVTVKHTNEVSVEVVVVPGDLSSAMVQVPLEIRLADRFCPQVVCLPFQRKGVANHASRQVAQSWFDEADRAKARWARSRGG